MWTRWTFTANPFCLHYRLIIFIQACTIVAVVFFCHSSSLFRGRLCRFRFHSIWFPFFSLSILYFSYLPLYILNYGARSFPYRFFPRPFFLNIFSMLWSEIKVFKVAIISYTFLHTWNTDILKIYIYKNIHWKFILVNNLK